MLPVKKIISIRSVLPDVDTASDFRQDHQMQVFVLKKNGFVGFIEFLVRNAIRKGVRIDLDAAALINPLLEEHGILVRRLLGISRDYYDIFPGSDTVAGRFRQFISPEKERSAFLRQLKPDSVRLRSPRSRACRKSP